MRRRNPQDGRSGGSRQPVRNTIRSAANSTHDGNVQILVEIEDYGLGKLEHLRDNRQDEPRIERIDIRMPGAQHNAAGAAFNKGGDDLEQPRFKFENQFAVRMRRPQGDVHHSRLHIANPVQDRDDLTNEFILLRRVQQLAVAFPSQEPVGQVVAFLQRGRLPVVREHDEGCFGLARSCEVDKLRATRDR